MADTRDAVELERKAYGQAFSTLVVRACFLLLVAGCHARGAPAAGAAALVRERYDRGPATRMGPMLCGVLRFPTVAGNGKAPTDQQAWLTSPGEAPGFPVRNAGL